MDNVTVVQVVNGIKYLANCLRCILLCELSVVANAIKQLSAGCQLSDDIEFVLFRGQPKINSSSKFAEKRTHLGFEPVYERDNVRVLELLQHLELIINHALISANIFLKNNLHGNFGAIGRLGFTDDSICTGTQGASELIESPIMRPRGSVCENDGLV